MAVDPKFIASLYEWSYDTLTQQIAGLTHEDSLLQPPGGGNCLNWVVGHILWSRNRILPYLGEQLIWTAEHAARYARGSQPVTPENAADAYGFDGMKLDLQNLQERTLSGLSRLTVADLDKPSDLETQTLGRRLITMNRHECYHTGATELLRALAGNTDQVMP